LRKISASTPKVRLGSADLPAIVSALFRSRGPGTEYNPRDLICPSTLESEATMSFRALVPCFLCIVSLAAGRAVAAAADALPSTSEIKQAFDEKQYPQVLQKLNRVLILKGKAAQAYNRHELLVIKGETHLRMKAMPAAAAAYAEASKEAPDGPAAATDIAIEQLFRKSTATLAYQPKAKDPSDKTKTLPPIDILEADSRKKAIAALFIDELAATEAVVKAARQAKSVTQILQALPAIRNVRWIEMAATGKDEKSKVMVGDLATKAKTLLETALKEMKQTIDDIERSAMEVTVAHTPVTDKQSGKILYFKNEYRYRGPNNRQVSTVQEVLTTCSKIYESCDEMGGSLGTTGKEFDAVKEQSKTVGTKANNIATHNWKQTYDQPPPGPPPAPK
jgi:effector-binding domain-containing protein